MKLSLDSREIATKIAWRYVGVPYKWGGDDPMAGFDCSGLCIEILKSVGVLPRKGDWTADKLHRIFEDRVVQDPFEGCLAFWLNDNGNAVHVEYCISETLTIGASGGGSKTTTEAEAVAANAFIKVRPLTSRPGRFVVVDPFRG
jgi:hypothetical protein